MTPNYKLSFNQSLRWYDLRGSNPLVPSGIQVRLDVCFSNKSSTPCIHIHNVHTRTIAENDKSIERMYTGIVGNGRIEHELFCLLNYKDLIQFFDDLDSWKTTIIFSFCPDSRLLYILQPYMIAEVSYFFDVKRHLWGYYTSFDVEYSPLCLAIPLLNVSVR